MRGGGRAVHATIGPEARERSDRGRRARAMIIRVPQEPGRPDRLHRDFRLGNRIINSPVPTISRRDRREQTMTPTVVSPSEGNEVRRDGRLGVGASHSIDEAGEQALLDPVEKRGRRVVGSAIPVRTRGHRTLVTGITVRPSKTAGRRDRHHETSQSWSGNPASLDPVKTQGEQPPWATRPRSRSAPLVARYRGIERPGQAGGAGAALKVRLPRLWASSPGLDCIWRRNHQFLRDRRLVGIGDAAS